MAGGLLTRWSGLQDGGVLGINARNRRYVMRYNPRHKYPLVDDKLTTKRLALEAGLAVPELYGAVRFQGELIKLDRLLDGLDSFVIKPAHGSGGDGVLVVTDRRRGLYIKGDGRALMLRDIEYFVSNILSGVHSLGGIPDAAMIEYRVRPSRLFDALSYRGVPDIRLLIFRGIPTMAMVRLPTRASDGKANLHQGAVGVGIALATGVTGHGVVRDQLIGEHPDFGTRLTGHAIPDWEALLAVGARCADLTGLGYCGVDLVLDEERGPMMLEVNARPGLAIQIANQCGLERRLGAIEAMQTLPTDIGERIALARALDEAERPQASAGAVAAAKTGEPAPEPAVTSSRQVASESAQEPLSVWMSGPETAATPKPAPLRRKARRVLTARTSADAPTERRARSGQA
ncbi:MAG: alpha-L-glutamate ligase-like protein [Thiohalocapsa sp.]|jgi:alpha-L-glutamate ligase-like protein|uniref:alpha-L-glutamate ligase-like protein n=1 Tax=Thiohalocapsa sp. TaxID=2497641 RepID=UPI0025F21EF1|nr:alpha-L-glutamate ligase-like protein [Thiohalocapsa sp.]MCG6943065.1 alpha-L-glutamate ligase-like protein [Thiohalocapsa sp.]